jgi:alcohol dehydrogenase class IV
MAHSLGGLLDLSHGECNALLLEHVIDFNFPSQPDKYLKMGEVMGIDFKGLDNDGKKESFINYLKDLKKACGMDNNLNVGITDKEISELAANTIKDPCIVTNPRLPSVENIVEIFKNAL